MSQETHKDKFDDVFHEIEQYQQIINSLREEMDKYKNNLGNALSQNTQYQQIIDSLKAEISEYKNKLDNIISTSIEYCKIIEYTSPTHIKRSFTISPNHRLA